MSVIQFLQNYWLYILLILIAFSGLFTVYQGFIGVVTMFGKYRRAARPGLNFKIPFLEQVLKKYLFKIAQKSKKKSLNISC